MADDITLVILFVVIVILLIKLLIRKNRKKFTKVIIPEVKPRNIHEEHFKRLVFLCKNIKSENAIDAILDKYNISWYYHMTHNRNLKNLLSKGIMSHTIAHMNNYVSVDISDNDVNVRRERIEPVYKRRIHDYVPLYFDPRNPMLYRRKEMQNELIILGIDRTIIYKKEAIFTDGNAASDGTRFFKDIQFLSNINWDCLNARYWNNFVDGKRIKCAEVLVLNKIEPSNIKLIFVNNENNYETVKNLLGDENNCEIIIYSKLFF